MEAAVQAAFRLRPDAGEAHLARAENLYFGYLDYDDASAELELAAEVYQTIPRYSRCRVTYRGVKGVGTNPQETWSAPLISTRATFTCCSRLPSVMDF